MPGFGNTGSPAGPHDVPILDDGADAGDPQIIELRSSMQALAETQATIMDMVKNTQAQQQQMQQTSQQDREPVTPPTAAIPNYPENVEEMSRQEYGEFMTTRTLAQMQEILQPLQQQIKDLGSSQSTSTAQLQISQMEAKHQDFTDWKPELAAIINQTPTLPLESAYKLARADNPEKAAQLDSKFSNTNADAEGDQDGPPARPPSFRPSPTIPQGSTAMPFDTAANSAWNTNADGLAQALRESNGE